MGRWRIQHVVVAIAMSGCAAPPKTEVTVTPVVSPKPSLYGRLRAGAFNLDSAQTTMEDGLVIARRLLKAAEGDPKQALQDLVDLVDEAGEIIADDTIAPVEADVAKDPVKYEKQRSEAIANAADAEKSIGSAAAISESLVQSAPEELRTDVEALDRSIQEAQAALQDAQKELSVK
jgi:hypothetical protein